MPLTTVWGVRAALLWLATAAFFGAMLLVRGVVGHPEWIRLLPMHAEMMVVGWMMQLAFGIAHWILPRNGPGTGRGNTWPVVFVLMALNVGVVLVMTGMVLVGRVLETMAVVGFVLQGIPRIRAAGWGATGKSGDLVPLKKRAELV